MASPLMFRKFSAPTLQAAMKRPKASSSVRLLTQLRPLSVFTDGISNYQNQLVFQEIVIAWELKKAAPTAPKRSLAKLNVTKDKPNSSGVFNVPLESLAYLVSREDASRTPSPTSILFTPPESLDEIGNQRFSPDFGDISPVNTFKEPENQLEGIPRGLPNNNSITCYVNSAIQSLFSFRFFMDAVNNCYVSFRRQFIKSVEARAIDDFLKVKLPILSRLVELHRRYQMHAFSSAQLEKSILNFKCYLGNKYDSRFGTQFQKDSQQDSVEFFNITMEMLRNEIDTNRRAFTSEFISNPVEEHFLYRLANHEVCPQCGQVSELKPDIATTFHLQLTPNRDLQSAFLKRLSTDTLPAKCSKCDVNRNLVKSFEKLPKVLAFQVARYSDAFVKDSKKIYASHNLHLPRSYITESMDPLSDCASETYQLAAIICHRGESLTSGHYVAYVCNSEQSKWFLCNDWSIKEVPFDNLLAVTSEESLCYFYVLKQD